MKRCKKCGAEKPYSEFSPHPRTRDRHRAECKVCNSALSVEWGRANRDKRSANTAAWRRRHPERSREVARASSHSRKYGLSRERFAALLAAQDNCCAICHEQFEKTPHVDHDHDTLAVRRLLCENCNKGLGMFRDKIELLLEAAKYLKQHGKAAVHEEFTVLSPATRETA